MSFIAVDLKVIEVSAPGVARALNLDVASIIGSLTLLWHRCWSLKLDKVSALELRGYFPQEGAGELLAAFGLVEPDPHGWRVKGAERYLRITEQRQKAGRARAASAGRSAGAFTSTQPAEHQRTTSGEPALTPNTEHRTPSTKETTLSSTLDLIPVELKPKVEPVKALEEKLTDDEWQVFECWRQTCGHPKAVASPARKKLIARWLPVYGVERLQKAIFGVTKSPHHMGQNDRNTRYDSLELILRDAEHIEGFERRAS